MPSTVIYRSRRPDAATFGATYKRTPTCPSCPRLAWITRSNVCRGGVPVPLVIAPALAVIVTIPAFGVPGAIVPTFQRTIVPEGEGKQAEVLGEGAAAAPRVVEVLREIGVLA